HLDDVRVVLDDEHAIAANPRSRGGLRRIERVDELLELGAVFLTYADAHARGRVHAGLPLPGDLAFDLHRLEQPGKRELEGDLLAGVEGAVAAHEHAAGGEVLRGVE